MARAPAADDGLLERLPLPLPSLGLGIGIRATPERLAEAAREALATEATWGLGDSGRHHLLDSRSLPSSAC